MQRDRSVTRTKRFAEEFYTLQRNFLAELMKNLEESDDDSPALFVHFLRVANILHNCCRSRRVTRRPSSIYRERLEDRLEQELPEEQLSVVAASRLSQASSRAVGDTPRAPSPEPRDDEYASGENNNNDESIGFLFLFSSPWQTSARLADMNKSAMDDEESGDNEDDEAETAEPPITPRSCQMRNMLHVHFASSFLK